MTTQSPAATASRLTWGLAIATYQRPGPLLQTVRCALRQNRPPMEVVICDSSPDAAASRAAVTTLVGQLAPQVRLVYLISKVAQQTIQRNCAARAAQADILFMIDDDTHMLPYCSEVVLHVYESAPRVVAVGLGPAPAFSDDEFEARRGKPQEVASTPSPGDSLPWIQLAFTYKCFVGQAAEAEFALERLCYPFCNVDFISGCYLTVRRSVALACPFDENLTSGLFEDGEAALNFSKRGAVVRLLIPMAHHANAPRPGGLHRRGAFIRFGWVLNLAYLNRKRYGDSLYVRGHSFFNLVRCTVEDLILGLYRGDFSRLRGCFYSVPSLVRMALAPHERIGQVLVAETIKAKERLF